MVQEGGHPAGQAVGGPRKHSLGHPGNPGIWPDQARQEGQQAGRHTAGGGVAGGARQESRIALGPNHSESKSERGGERELPCHLQPAASMCSMAALTQTLPEVPGTRPGLFKGSAGMPSADGGGRSPQSLHLKPAHRCWQKCRVDSQMGLGQCGHAR